MDVLPADLLVLSDGIGRRVVALQTASMLVLLLLSLWWFVVLWKYEYVMLYYSKPYCSMLHYTVATSLKQINIGVPTALDCERLAGQYWNSTVWNVEFGETVPLCVSCIYQWTEARDRFFEPEHLDEVSNRIPSTSQSDINRDHTDPPHLHLLYVLSICPFEGLLLLHIVVPRFWNQHACKHEQRVCSLVWFDALCKTLQIY